MIPRPSSIMIFPDDTNAFLGGKGSALAHLTRAGFDVPPWFAVPPDLEWTPEELSAALSQIGGDLFAVRSSGAMEDGSGHSFAGQFDTFLEVPAHEVAKRIQDVRASASGKALLAYCQERNLPPPPPPVAIVQRMILPRHAGVAFSADPVTGRRRIRVVAAVEGTGEKLVSGEVDGETWRIGDGTVESPPRPTLSEQDALRITRLARDCERHFGRPQDIEWAIDVDGHLWLLQSRPITTLSSTPDPDDPPVVWDNSNIAESYGGVTTPLTFSFARRIYESVYREFCRLMSVPSARIARADDVFPRMLGLIRGRTYYNLGSWYRVLALLPGFKLNRGFMEQMMGVREPLPAELVDRIAAENTTGRLRDALSLTRTFAGLLYRFVFLRRDIKAFRKRLDDALAQPSVPLGEMTGQELAAHYFGLESRLLKKWDAPLVNDFFAMIFYGVLRTLCGRWAGDRDGTLQNELLARTGGIVSAEPPRRIVRMARLAAAIPGLPSLLADPGRSEREKRAALGADPILMEEFTRYLDDFGDRCLEELKLESPTVRDDATTLLSSIGALALRGDFGEDGEEARDPVPAIGNPLKRAVFRWVLSQARERVRCRENLRFERTRLFGRVRSVLREMGKRLHADDRLSAPDDVFYLELGEVLAVWDSTGTQGDLSALADLRRREFDGYRTEPAPPDRIETRGPVHRYRSFESARSTPAPENEGDIKGVGACPGKVTGRVRVVLDPRGATLEPGEILVALQTDPGWVVLFPAASGLLVERGSLLSHSAIVARELRLPCIVSLPGIITRLHTGDLVEMDGATGIVRILAHGTHSHPEAPSR